MKRILAAASVGALLLASGGATRAQLAPEDPDWQESQAPAPPPFDMGKLVQFDVSSTSALLYGVDPASIKITQGDGLVRYVMVARSPGGASNVMYEALRCSTAQVKTYARYSAGGGWQSVANPEWISLSGNNLRSRHALAFAKAGACDNTLVPDSVDLLVKRLKEPNLQISQ